MMGEESAVVSSSGCWRREEKGGRKSHPFIRYFPTTSQIVSLMAHRRPVFGVDVLRLECAGNRRTPLGGESERILAQSGHSIRSTPLSRKRLSSMETTPENVHLAACTC